MWRLDLVFRVRENVFLFTRILEQNGPEATDALPEIIERIQDRRWRVRGAAINLVELIGGDAALQAVPALREALSDEADLVRLQAARTLKAIGQPVETPSLEEPKSEP
jgi:HEAT repeat protein